MNVRRVLPADAIESIDDPSFSPGYDGDADDQVLVLEPDAGPPKAYPILILNYHEIVNDALDGTPVAVTWCPLCGSAVVYDRTVEGRELTFGVSGKLAEDDLVMYDRETDSEWKQSTGECIAGQFEDRSLSVRPAAMLTADRFAEAYLDGVVLDRPRGERSVVAPSDEGEGLVTETREIDYSVDHYDNYVEGDWIGSRGRGSPREWQRTDIAAKAVVLGIEIDGDAIAVPRSTVVDRGGVQLTIGGTEVLVLEADGDIHAYEDPGFSLVHEASGRCAGDGTVWDGATGRGADGRRLDRVPAKRMFAFAWQSDHGPDAFALED